MIADLKAKEQGIRNRGRRNGKAQSSKLKREIVEGVD